MRAAASADGAVLSGACKKAHSDKPATPPPSLAQAFAYGEAVKKNYSDLIHDQENFRRYTTVAVIAAGATTLFYTVTGGASKDVLTALAVGGGGLYVAANVLTSRLEQEVFLLGYEGVNCVLGDYGRLNQVDRDLARFVRIGNETHEPVLKTAIAEAEAAVNALAAKAKPEKESDVRSIFAGSINSAKDIESKIFSARYAISGYSSELVPRIDEVQKQVVTQKKLIGTDPLAAARNPFQLVLQQSAGFAPKPIVVPTVSTANLAAANILANDTWRDTNPPTELLQEASTRIRHLQEVAAEAQAVLSAHKETIDKGPDNTTCSLPDQSSKLVLKTLPSTEIKINKPKTGESAKLISIKIIDNSVLGVIADWIADTPLAAPNGTKVVATTVPGTSGSLTAVEFRVTDTTTTGNYLLYIVDTLGRFSTTIKVEIENPPTAP